MKRRIPMTLAVPLVLTAALLSGAGEPGRPGPADPEVERFLGEGRVVDEQEIPVGVTKPIKVTLELDGHTMKAVFKTVDTRYTSERGADLPDSYRFDRAAYLIDRQLGLNMVPVVVLRSHNGRSGAMVEWVPDAFSERDRQQQDRKPDDFRVLNRQQDLMKLFDALILNLDRNQTNMLYTADWRLHLIDHSRAFHTWKTLPDAFVKNQVALNRELLARLEALDEARLQGLLEGLLDRAKLRALLARRDRIVRKIADDRKKFGDWVVFPDEP